MDQLKVLKGLYHGRQTNKKTPKNIELDANEKHLLHCLKQEGIVTIEGFFSTQETSELRESLEKTLNDKSEEAWAAIAQGVKLPQNKYGMEQPDGVRIWTDDRHSDQRINGFEKISETAALFAHNESFLKIAKAYLEREITLRFCMANRTRFVEKNSGSGGGWHRDMNYKKGFKALVYLVDVTEENGCFQYLPKSSSALHHLLKTPIADKYQFSQEDVMAMVSQDATKIMNLTAKAGTVVLFDTNGVHRGKPIEKDSRYALTNYYHDN